MAKFMFLMRGGDCSQGRSPEEMQEAMKSMGEWMQRGTDAGWLLDPGDGLKSAGSVVHADHTVTDGPFAESKEWVGGYCMVQAEDLAGAVELAKAMPVSGGAIEVRELDLLRVKGKQRPVAVYELLGLAGELPEGR
ncbi:MAG: YciI family protein, partial [Acidobacteriota bacterium]